MPIFTVYRTLSFSNTFEADSADEALALAAVDEREWDLLSDDIDPNVIEED